MSRDSYSICRPCGVFQDNGVVLNATVIDHQTSVEAFDRELARREGVLRDDDDNTRIRAFLAEHEGHGGVEYWSWDWVYDEDDPLKGLKHEPAPQRGRAGR
jgi:hypothetical protein